MKMNTINYIFSNRLDFVMAMQFTINDLRFMNKEGFEEIIINEKKPTTEILNEQDIISRIEDLYKLVQVARVTSGIYDTHESYMENLTMILDRDMKKFGVEIKLK